jgi:hypothetical protein
MRAVRCASPHCQVHSNRVQVLPTTYHLATRRSHLSQSGPFATPIAQSGRRLSSRLRNEDTQPIAQTGVPQYSIGPRTMQHGNGRCLPLFSLQRSKNYPILLQDLEMRWEAVSHARLWRLKSTEYGRALRPSIAGALI